MVPFDSKEQAKKRRDVLKAAGATITLASFAGCAGGGDATPGDGTEQPTSTPMGEQSIQMEGFAVPGDNVAPKSELSSDQEIGELTLIVNPPKTTPNDYETSKLVAKEVSKLGVDVSVETKTWPSQVEAVWYGDDWHITFWQMVGRPSRLDPDEFLVQMFHQDFQAGYNYYFWEDEKYNELVMDQRQETDRKKRQGLVKQCQQIIHERGPSTFLMYPKKTIAWNADKWDGVVELTGMGSRNMLSFSQMKPTTDDTELVVSGDAEIEYINPFQQSGEIDLMQNRMLWDRLVWPNENAKPTPRFATELNWQDDTTLEVPIRQGATFHNGEEILADDVKFSYEVHQDNSTYYSGAVKPIESIEVADDYRLIFHLSFPFAPFPMTAMGRIGITSKKKWEDIIQNKMEQKNPMLYQEDKPLGSGPLKFDFWKQGNETRLTKFEDHWDPVAYDSRVTRIIPSQQTVLAQLQQGTIDMLGNYKGDKNVLQSTVEKSDSLEMTATTTVGFKQLSYNNDKAPFHIEAFRQAFHHRVDKKLITEQIYSGWGEAAPNSPTSSALTFWHNNELEPYEVSLQAAANKLATAGFKWDESDGKLHMPADNTKPEVTYTETES